MGRDSQTRETVPSRVDISLAHADHSESTGGLTAGTENAMFSVHKNETIIDFKNTHYLHCPQQDFPRNTQK